MGHNFAATARNGVGQALPGCPVTRQSPSAPNTTTAQRWPWKPAPTKGFLDSLSNGPRSLATVPGAWPFAPGSLATVPGAWLQSRGLALCSREGGYGPRSLATVPGLGPLVPGGWPRSPGPCYSPRGLALCSREGGQLPRSLATVPGAWVHTPASAGSESGPRGLKNQPPPIALKLAQGRVQYVSSLGQLLFCLCQRLENLTFWSMHPPQLAVRAGQGD